MIAKIIQCKENGVCMDMYSRTSPFIDNIPPKILTNLYNLASVSSLLPEEKIWHQLVVSNIQPREKDLDTLTYEDKLFILFFLSRIKVNLPLTIFNFTNKIIIFSHDIMYFIIPIRRVLSELFVQEGIVKKVQDVSLTKALETHWTLKLEVVKGTFGVRPSSPFYCFVSLLLYLIFQINEVIFFPVILVFTLTAFTLFFLIDEKEREKEYNFDISLTHNKS